MDKQEWIEREIERVTHQTGKAERDVEPCAKSAKYDVQSKRVLVEMGNGCLFAFPAKNVQGLEDANDDDLSDIELLGGGSALHWPRVNADIRVESVLKGIFGSKKWMMRLAASEAGSHSSERKKLSSRENGKKGGRPRKAA